MSIKYKCDFGYFVVSEEYFSSFAYSEDTTATINENLFKIFCPYAPKRILGNKYKKPKEICNQIDNIQEYDDLKHEIKFVQEKYSTFLDLIQNQGYLKEDSVPHKNISALETAEFIYEQTGKNLITNSFGSNDGPPIMKTIKDSRYLFPRNCTFFSKDINEISTHLQNQKFDFILLDPPWWNKYIRRKKRKCSHAYNMMYNDDLMKIPIEDLLSENGIVGLWCTNSPQHLKAITKDFFHKWDIKLVGKWFWVKVTRFGEPICDFSDPPGKQPFEQIIFGARNLHCENLPTDGKLIVSVPSAIHSHKPPLTEMLQPFLPENPKCLEIFARYLLPNWTSYGNEVLRFQHESLFSFQKESKDIKLTKS